MYVFSLSASAFGPSRRDPIPKLRWWGKLNELKLMKSHSNNSINVVPHIAQLVQHLFRTGGNQTARNCFVLHERFPTNSMKVFLISTQGSKRAWWFTSSVHLWRINLSSQINFSALTSCQDGATLWDQLPHGWPRWDGFDLAFALEAHVQMSKHNKNGTRGLAIPEV